MMELNLIDERGRLFIPAEIQRRLALSPGMTLVVEQGDAERGEMWLQLESPTVVEKEGVLVIEAEPFDDLMDIVKQEREARLGTLLGRMEAYESST